MRTDRNGKRLVDRRSGGVPIAPFWLLAGFLLAIHSSQAPAEIYRWTDDQGLVHFGDRPPQDRETREIPAAVPPPGDDVRNARQRLDRWLERHQRREQLRVEDRERARRENAAALQREQRLDAECSRAQRELETLQGQRRVFYTDPDGEPVFIEDDERTRLIADIEAFIQARCQ